jgi:hypothetical protein
VTYAKQNAQKNDVVAGTGLGFVDVFTTDGVLIKGFASRGTLNAPWGVTRATQNFGEFSGAILIGNFGSQGNAAGWINAFSGGEDNDFRCATLRAIRSRSTDYGRSCSARFSIPTPIPSISRRGQISRRTACSAGSWRSQATRQCND